MMLDIAGGIILAVIFFIWVVPMLWQALGALIVGSYIGYSAVVEHHESIFKAIRKMVLSLFLLVAVIACIFNAYEVVSTRQKTENYNSLLASIGAEIGCEGKKACHIPKVKEISFSEAFMLYVDELFE